MKKLFTLILFIFGFTEAKSQSYVIAYEYWCDTSYSSRVLVSIPPQEQFFLDTSLGFPGVSKGLHLLNIRFQQNNFFWSQTVTEYFYKTGEGVSQFGQISAYRYWVESVDSVVTFHLSTPVSPYNLIANLDLSWVPSGSTYLYVQFGDEAGNWSVATVDSIFKTVLPVSLFKTDDTLICGIDSVHFQNQSIDANEYQWYFGDGDSSNIEHPVHLYSQPGQYTVTLIVEDTIGGADSTLTITNYISIFPPAQVSFTLMQSGPTVTFTNNSTNAVSYLWDFGDSTTSNLQNPVHTYLFDGNYTIILTAFDTCGNSLTDTQYVSIVLNAGEIESSGDIIISQFDKTLSVYFNLSVERGVYSLENISGQVLLKGALRNIQTGYVETLTVERLPSGLYFLNVYEEARHVRKKILIMH